MKMQITHNLLKISKTRMGGGKTLLPILLTVLVFCAIACACSKQPVADTRTAEPTPVTVPASLFHDRDSVMYYAERAYKLDDPKGQFVVGACFYLRCQNGAGHADTLPDYIYTVSRPEADTMLMRAAAQNYQPAIDLIHCLSDNGDWMQDNVNEKGEVDAL